MPDASVRTVYVQQQQVPRGWQDHVETGDRAIANGAWLRRLHERVSPSAPTQ